MSKTKSLAWSAVGALAALGVLLVPGAKGAHEVVIRDGKFQPQESYLGQGDTMVFIHDDGDASHTVTADDGSFDSSPGCTKGTEEDCLNAGETWEYNFAKVGRYPIHSKTNPAVKGVIIVVEKGTGPSTSTTG
ncbi:MAG: cupredoxin domain-containing protein [Acidimicrobiia bacterium]